MPTRQEGYQGYLIADLKTGLELDKEPWLLPKDAFSEVSNAYLHRGVITKRLGYTEFGRLENFDRQDLLGDYTVVEEADTITLAANLLTNAVTTMAHETYVYKDFTANYWDADFKFNLKLNASVTDTNAETFTWMVANLVNDAKGIDDAAGDFLGLRVTGAGALFTLDLVECLGGTLTDDTSSNLSVATDYWVTITRDESVGTHGTLYCYIYSDVNRTVLVDTLTVTLGAKKDFRYVYAFSVYKDGGAEDTSWTMSDFGPLSYPDLPVVGVLNFYPLAGGTELLVANTRRLFKWNTSRKLFDDITYTDTWNGGSSNYIHEATWQNVMYMTNGADQIVTYDGSTVAKFDIDIDGAGAANDVNTCKMIFAHKARLIILGTTETTSFPRRARWCKVNNPADWTNDGYVDADTVEWVVAGDFLGPELITFWDRSIWKLQYTGDSALPFAWEQISISDGAYATFSVSVFSDELVALGPTGLVVTDGIDSYAFAEKIPDFTLTTNLSALAYAYSADLDELRQTWLSYVSTAATLPDKILVLNYQEKNWSVHDLAFLVFGYYSIANDLTWDEVDETWDETEYEWDNRGQQAGYPTTLGGSSTGYIYQMNTSTTDDGTPINMTVTSGRWNPYSEMGEKARFGWLDIFADVDPSVTITLTFYKDTEAASYLTKTLTFEGITEKRWYRVPVNQIGAFHKVVITHSGSQQVRIHALYPHFKPAGRI